MSRRRLTLALVLAGAVAALTGGAVSNAVDPVAAAATGAANAGGAKMTVDVRLTGPAGKSYRLEAQGAFDQNEGEMTVELANLPATVGLPAGAASGIQIRYLRENGDPVVYADVPFLASILPGGKTWLRLDLETAAKGLGVDLDQVLGEAAESPEQVLEQLLVSGSVEKIGTATVGGVATTEYGGTIELAKIAQLGGASGLETLLAQLESQGLPSTIPVKVWVDGSGLVHRIVSDETISTGGQQVLVSTTVEIGDYGTAVSVSAPPAGEVFDLSGLASQALAKLVEGAGSTTTTG